MLRIPETANQPIRTENEPREESEGNAKMSTWYKCTNGENVKPEAVDITSSRKWAYVRNLVKAKIKAVNEA